MITVYKYPLHFDQHGVAHVYAPQGRALKVAMQNDKSQNLAPVVWIHHEVPEQDTPKRLYSYRVVMTGEELPDHFGVEWSYLDTLFKGWLVLHIFEDVKNGRHS